MVLAYSAPKQGRIGHEPLEARSRREIFRHICAVVFDVAPRWGDAIDEGAAIVVTSPLLTRADVQSVFDEISEKYHVAGIALRFDEQDGRPLQAIFDRGWAAVQHADSAKRLKGVHATRSSSSCVSRDRRTRAALSSSWTIASA